MVFAKYVLFGVIAASLIGQYLIFALTDQMNTLAISRSESDYYRVVMLSLHDAKQDDSKKDNDHGRKTAKARTAPGSETAAQTHTATPVLAQKPKPAPNPQPKPQPTLAAKLGPIGCSFYRPLVEQYNWDADIAMAIMKAESDCNPGATNATDWHEHCLGSFGLMQISCDMGKIYDPAKNVKAAWAKYTEILDSGQVFWKPWTTYTSGKYLEYLGKV